MTLQDIIQQFDYIYWARDRVLDIVETLDQEAFTRDMHTSHRSIHETLVHMFGSEKLWSTRWKGESPMGRERSDNFPTAAAVRTHWKEIETDIRGILAGMSSGDESRIVLYKTLEGVPVVYPWWQTAVQVTNHSTYHRGQVITLLRQLGVQATGTDMIMYFKLRNANG